ncbi:holin family protein [Paenibacillus farraposensis]|uniref:Holin family protein n=1 Tax=Paenibacillus farraposensis TaxID=2807095 RepID=A0ABW4DJR5_9BACL|nr:phage holin family protein [Paenibacillus farraposensis]MCC3381084.1 phage holin family protein [Paenibacillus farraposensis]
MAFHLILSEKKRGRQVDKSEFYKFGAAFGGSAVTYLFGGWSFALAALLTFTIIDYVTGLFAAWVEGRRGMGPGLKSKIGLIGISRKVFIFAMVAVGHIVDGILGDSHLFRDTVAYFYLSNELLSIVENGNRVGAPIPPIIRQALEVLKSKGGNQKGEKEDAGKGTR